MATDIEAKPDVLLYPDSDGQPMSDNTLQFRWIVTFQGNLDLLFGQREDVFVAGDLLWYAEEGNPAERVAPDAMVVFGRPKGDRGSYQQWLEEGIAPQVVFEVLSPGNRSDEMNRKFDFYERHGVEEYYVYDPDLVQLTAWMRMDGRLRPVYPIGNHISPRLQIRFDLSGNELVIYGPDGRRFKTFVEIGELLKASEREAAEARRVAADALAREERSRREAEEARAQEERSRREAEEARAQEELSNRAAESAQRRTEQLAARLRELGVDPDSLPPPKP
jgi:Uma2 family endonuclease